ncbi:MAG: adenosine kinase [Methylobacteriaceae bacterium]|jgi:sugar/nucleoside kinase (ribokinase family)|nr:adenosine kinase [Methylobacteriaceae bacterium]
MPHKPLDVLTIGNAIVDILAHADDSFIIEQNIVKGAMQLIDEERALALYKAMGPATVMSGGSAANTAAGIAGLGGKAGFIGKVRNDGLGNSFRHDLKALGISYTVAPAVDGPATARCFVLVTPDGERTMNTYLGASQNLSEDDIDPAVIGSAEVVYLEGYLWDPPAAKQAFRKAIKAARKAKSKVAFTLSDSFCVDRYREEFLGLIRHGDIDILFANTAELKSLYETSDELTAVQALKNEGVLGVVTRSEKGVYVVTREETRSFPAFPVESVVDTTGAGDLFAAGFLAALSKGLDMADAAGVGALAAAEVITHIGPRPQVNLLDLARQEGYRM